MRVYHKASQISFVCLLILAMLVSLFAIPVQAARIPFSGSASEWGSIDFDTVSSVNDLTQLKAVQKGGVLYLNVKGNNLEVDSTFYIDSDNDTATGYNLRSWNNSSGIDYKLFNESIYQYVNEEWVDTGKTVSIEKNSTLIEAAVNLSDLGSLVSSDLKVAFFKPANGYLPEPSKGMLTVPAEQTPYVDDVPVIVDGLTSDWSGVDVYASSMDGLTTVTTSVYNNRLNVLLEGFIGNESDMNNIWEHFYLDTDADATTGVGWGNYGAEYLVQKGNLFTASGAGWDLDHPAAIDYVAVDNGINDRVIEFSIPFEYIGLDYPQGIHLAFTTGTINSPDPWAPPIQTKSALPSIVVDGNPVEWGGIGSLASSSNDIIRSFSGFVKSGDSLNFLVYSSQPITNYYLSMNTDNDSATGYQNYGQYGSNAGADYMVNDGSLLQRNSDANDDTWSWTWVASVHSVISNVYALDGGEVLEISVPLNLLESPANTIYAQIEINNSAANTDYAPGIWNVDGSYVELLTSAGREIIVDGDDSDWAEIDNIAIAVNSPLSMSVTQDDKKLYVLIEGMDLNTQNIFYIDSDNDHSTGIQIGDWLYSGIDYKVEYHKLFRYQSATSSWEEIGPVYLKITPATVEMSLYLDMIGRTSPGPMKISYMSKYAYTLPAFGQEMLSANAVISNMEQPGTFYPRESFELLNNPYMGWVPWSMDSDIASNQVYPQPHSMVYTGISWRELEPEKGQFAWEAIEDKYQFDFWSALGKRINLRLIMDYPTDDPNHMDIPDWLYDELVQAEGAAGAGKWYDTSEIGSGFAPNYHSTVLLSEHDRVIEAIAERYDYDPRIAFIQIGSLGHWGEFHNWPEGPSGRFPNVTVSDQYVQHYLDHFHNKMTGMRKPFPIAAQNHMGLFNDVFGDKSSTDQFLGWTKDGWGEIVTFNDTDMTDDELLAASAMPDFWKYSFSGGEFSNGLSALWLKDSTIMETLRQARESHLSWLGPESPVNYKVGDRVGPAGSEIEITENIVANMDVLLRTMGYRFVLDAVSHEYEVTAGTTITIDTEWNNQGIAPFYFDWPLQISLADSNGTVVASTNADDIDIRNWLPGRTTETVELAIPHDLYNGVYTVLISIIDPETDEPGIELGIEGKRADGRYALDEVTVSGGLTPPTPPSTPPSASPDANGTKIVDHPRAVDGTIKVSFDQAEREVLLPTHAEAFNNLNRLEIESDQFVVDIPAEVLSQLQNMAGDGNKAQISFKYSILSPEEADHLANSAVKSRNTLFKVAGQVYDFALSVITEDGEASYLTDFTSNLILKLKISNEADTNRSGIYYIGDNGELEYLGGILANGMLTAEVAHFSKYAILEYHKTFDDVSSEHWAAEQIARLAAQHIVNGVSDTEFAPERYVTRAEFTALLVRALRLGAEGDIGFQDVENEAWYASAVAAAYDAGIVTGYNETTFAPEEFITREEMASMTIRAYEKKLGAAVILDDEPNFADNDLISDWAKADVGAAGALGFVQGRGNGRFAPNEFATRAESAKVITNLIEK